MEENFFHILLVPLSLPVFFFFKSKKSYTTTTHTHRWLLVDLSGQQFVCSVTVLSHWIQFFSSLLKCMKEDERERQLLNQRERERGVTGRDWKWARGSLHPRTWSLLNFLFSLSPFNSPLFQYQWRGRNRRQDSSERKAF